MAISLTAHTHRRASLARAAVALSLSAGLLTAGWVAETQAAPVSSTSAGTTVTSVAASGSERPTATAPAVAILPDDQLTTQSATSLDRRKEA